jgi:hypothetical protein
MEFKIEKSDAQSSTPINLEWASTSSYKIKYKIVYKVLD